MKKYFLHLKTILKHKWFVMVECFKVGLYWQGIIHDLSKFMPVEFFSSARYFQGDKTPIEAEKAELGYSRAWLNHKGKNKHHWEYWVDWHDGKIYFCPIPRKYVLEMACDMVGASKAYLKGKFSPEEPYKYYLKNKNSFLMRAESKLYLEKLLKAYALSRTFTLPTQKAK